MHSFLTKNKIIIAIVYILIAIIFYSYNITLTWDSSEYLGLADQIGNANMKQNWITHRGFAFPLLLKFGKIIGIKNLMFIFYTITSAFLLKICLQLKKINILTEKAFIFFILYTIFIILLHPIVFSYFHTALTEFVAMSFAIISIYLSWNFINCFWEEHPKKFFLYTFVFSLITIFIYHVKQSLTPIILIPILVASCISIYSVHNKKNIISRILSILFIICFLALSIFIWKNLMGDVVIEATYNHNLSNSVLESDNIISSCITKYLRMIIIPNSEFWVYQENLAIGNRIYIPYASNIIDCNENYRSYIEPFTSPNPKNLVSTIFNFYLGLIYISIICYTKITLLIAPFILITLCIVYLFINKKLPKNVLSLYHLTIILYATTFLGIFAYAFLGAQIDRYTVPLIFTSMLSNLTLVLLIIHLIKHKSTLLLPKA